MRSGHGFVSNLEIQTFRYGEKKYSKRSRRLLSDDASPQWAPIYQQGIMLNHISTYIRYVGASVQEHAPQYYLLTSIVELVGSCQWVPALQDVRHTKPR